MVQAGSGAGGEGGSVVHLDFTNEAGAFHDFTQARKLLCQLTPMHCTAAHVREKKTPNLFQQRPAKNMPVNPTEKHPVQLLNELRG